MITVDEPPDVPRLAARWVRGALFARRPSIVGSLEALRGAFAEVLIFWASSTQALGSAGRPSAWRFN
ncbi:hypothetical protein [Streptomyces sp. NPDC096142]|uniref:hypothetical protein n=1 Tax=Streptomyces sp. NPDC096142 TaxID=3366077 RepID=UPI00381C3903